MKTKLLTCAIAVCSLAGLVASCDDETAAPVDGLADAALDTPESDVAEEAGELVHPYRDDAVALIVTDFEEIVGDQHDGPDPELCRMAYMADGGAGVYEVARITGVYEVEAFQDAEDGEAWTYIELHQIEDWSGTAPAVVVIRESGGPLLHGLYSSDILAFRRDEIVAVFFSNPEEANAGFSLSALSWILHSETNGRTFASQYFCDGALQDGEELGVLVREYYDALPDVDHPWPLTPEDIAPIPPDTCPLQACAPW